MLLKASSCHLGTLLQTQLQLCVRRSWQQSRLCWMRKNLRPRRPSLRLLGCLLHCLTPPLMIQSSKVCCMGASICMERATWRRTTWSR
ncbi:hypothetical protein L7F22_000396, partial [Adiantum nelumboides]|nr:hypothetical protein [Adiantum nelumboides]